MAARLEEIKNGASVRGIASAQAVHVISVDWIGDQAISVVFRDHNGTVAEAVLYRDDEHRLEVEQSGRPWSFDADGALLRLVTEANRIKLAHYFDPYLAIHTSLVDPLPHQISAVYGEMLPRQPLRFLLADDPGAGKTIMAGLLMKELIARSDLERCLVVAPGSLVEQWQDELGQKFNLEFDILSRDMIENSRSGNPFSDRDRLIVRLDVLARNEELQEKLMSASEWDLIIFDEAHRMSATYFGGEVKYTRRYQVGQKLGQVCRHLLLMSATPHNGKEEDFQLFMALLDGDRFEGRFRDGVHYADTEDMMRRLTKEELLKFDGRPLFPERRARTVKYQLSEGEAALYTAVTEYVRTEMNRVQRFAEGDGKKRNNVGFALQILQRRLASSPAAIYQSLKRRRERLENELGEARLAAKGRRAGTSEPMINADMLGNIEEYGQEEIDELEDLISTGATTAETVEQLALEVETLKGLETMALGVLRSGVDTKWSQLNRILDDDLMVDAIVAPIDGAGGVLGSAGPCVVRSGGLPAYGVMKFDSADLASLESDGLLSTVILHEMGHVLGIGTVWNSPLLTGSGTSNPVFTGAVARGAWQAIGGTGNVPVENSGGAGTANSHWRETTFNAELMTGYVDPGSNPMSRVTVGSLSDLGYGVALDAADPYGLPGLRVASAAAPRKITTQAILPKGRR